MKKNTENTEDQKDIIIDMPEVKDIPGQEHIKPPRMGEMADVTVSSAGEEGEGLLDELNTDEEDESFDEESDVSTEESELLDETDRPVTDETTDLRKLALDKTDDEDELNQEGDPLDMGEDLDIPGSELDDEDENIGEEDEENNSYSTRD